MNVGSYQKWNGFMLLSKDEEQMVERDEPETMGQTIPPAQGGDIELNNNDAEIGRRQLAVEGQTRPPAPEREVEVELSNGVEIGRQQLVRSLEGWWKKRLSVPSGMVVVVTRPNGQTEVLQVGEHHLSAEVDLFGFAQSTFYALLPEKITLPIALPRLQHVPQLLSLQDATPVDFSAILTLTLRDPARFYTKWIAPQGVATTGQLQTALAQQLAKMAPPLLASYHSQQLEESGTRKEIGAKLSAQLSLVVADWGLGIEELAGINITSAEDLIVHLTRCQEAEEQLGQLRNEGFRNTLELLANRQRILQEVEETHQLYGLMGGVEQAVSADSPPTAVLEEAAQRVRGMGQAWSAGMVAQARAFVQRSAELPEKISVVVPPSYALLAIIFLLPLLIAVLIGSVWGWWAAVLVGLTLLVVALGRHRLIRHRQEEARLQKRWETLPYWQLTQGEFLRLDQLVKQQVGKEVKQSAEQLRQLRLNAPKAWLLPIKELEVACDRLLSAVETSKPLYLSSHFQYSPPQLEGVFNQEMSLINDARQLSDSVRQGRDGLRWEEAGREQELFRPLQLALAQFQDQLDNRGRYLLSSPNAS